MKRLIFLYLLVCSVAGLSAQHKAELPEYTIRSIPTPITVDGKEDDEGWKSIDQSPPYWGYFPIDTGYSHHATDLKIACDKTHLYILVKCHTIGNKYITPSLRRDFRAGGSDNITFLIDPNGDRTTAYFFGVNPYGVSREGLVSNGGADLRDFSVSWDNKWRASCKIYDDYWLAEMAIPFNIIRYQKGKDTWRMNSYRFDTQTNENMTWSHIPRNQWIFGLAFMGSIHFEQALPEDGGSLSVIPYASVDWYKDPASTTKPNAKTNIGGDIKIAMTPSMNLDLTFNPDFSQVEVDQQVTNLTRFEISFPEARQFFQENADLFATYGNENIKPFFSRRIGIRLDSLTQTNVLNPIAAGFRLTGKLTPNLRTGLLHMIAAADKKSGLPAYHYSVLSLQRKTFSRSNLSFQWINKQTFDRFYAEKVYDRYNRVGAIEYNLASSNNEWMGKAFYQRSFSPIQQKNPFALGTQILLLKPKYRISWSHEQVGGGFDAQVGFIPRTDYTRITPNVGLVYLPTHGIFAAHGPFLEAAWTWSPGLGKTDHSYTLGWQGQMRNFSPFEISVANQFTYLFAAFTPSGKGLELAKGSDYSYINVRVQFGTDRRKAVSSEFLFQIGEFYNGHIVGLTSMFMIRHQPFISLTGVLNYNKISMPAPYTSNDIWLLGPRFDLTLTRNFFITSFFQYNSLGDNVNINARIQWRYAPVSDLFLVYTDNYYPEEWGLKNRSLVAKLTYWLNM